MYSNRRTRSTCSDACRMATSRTSAHSQAHPSATSHRLLHGPADTVTPTERPLPAPPSADLSDFDAGIA